MPWRLLNANADRFPAMHLPIETFERTELKYFSPVHTCKYFALQHLNIIISGVSRETCDKSSCDNQGTCLVTIRGHECDCDLTSFTGPRCSDGKLNIKGLFGLPITARAIRALWVEDWIALAQKYVQYYFNCNSSYRVVRTNNLVAKILAFWSLNPKNVLGKSSFLSPIWIEMNV